ncbi:MAG: preprotein translocase subunit SecE [Gemmatimonadales bacterium]|jgi:preprotein translocase subunit SecE|nr:MAG: preprotein translocase subunit SecE [Gemmatimonadales bacterium]
MAVQKIQETKEFIEESWVELRKVTWPDYEQLKNATIVVLVFLVIISATIWVMDLIVRTIIDLIMGMFGA